MVGDEETPMENPSNETDISPESAVEADVSPEQEAEADTSPQSDDDDADMSFESALEDYLNPDFGNLEEGSIEQNSFQLAFHACAGMARLD